MKQIELKCGLTIQVDEEFMDDMEFLDCLADADDENPAAMSRLVVKLLGREQRKKLYDALRTEAGRVPVKAISDVVVEIFTAFKDEGKNS